MSQDATQAGAQVFVLGATHHRVPISVREQLALGKEGAAQMREQLAAMPGLREFVVLSTCNRVEFYGVQEHPGVSAAVRRAFCQRQRFDEAAFEGFAINLRDQAAIQHLLEVASGLDSQMLGETEIFGQVKDAYSQAQSSGSTGQVLNRVFQKAFQAAKRVRTETAITVGQVSLANVAVDLALDIFGRLRDTRVFLIGAGEIGEKTAQAFKSRGATMITVSSRRFERAVELAGCLGASALPFEQRETRLAEFDVVVCATSAPDQVLQCEAVRSAMRARPGRPMLCLDLAMPRDIDPAAGALENVYLYNLDDLAKVAEANRKAREAEVDKAKGFLTEKALQLWTGLIERQSGGSTNEKTSQD